MPSIGSVESAVEALKVGAFDCLSKPLDLEELGLVVGKALQAVRQAQELDYQRAQVDKENPTRDIVGQSKNIIVLRNLIEQIAADTAVFLLCPIAVLICSRSRLLRQLCHRDHDVSLVRLALL